MKKVVIIQHGCTYADKIELEGMVMDCLECGRKSQLRTAWLGANGDVVKARYECECGCVLEWEDL